MIDTIEQGFQNWTGHRTGESIRSRFNRSDRDRTGQTIFN
jgi:hypothetical protein